MGKVLTKRIQMGQFRPSGTLFGRSYGYRMSEPGGFILGLQLLDSISGLATIC